MELHIIKIFVNVLILSLLISLCSGLHGHRKLAAFEDGEVAAYSGIGEDVQDNLNGIANRSLIDVEAMLDYENPGSNTRHQPGRGRGPRPRF